MTLAKPPVAWGLTPERIPGANEVGHNQVAFSESVGVRSARPR